MDRPNSFDLRERVVAAMVAGMSGRERSSTSASVSPRRCAGPGGRARPVTRRRSASNSGATIELSIGTRTFWMPTGDSVPIDTRMPCPGVTPIVGVPRAGHSELPAVVVPTGTRVTAGVGAFPIDRVRACPSSNIRTKVECPTRYGSAFSNKNLAASASASVVWRLISVVSPCAILTTRQEDLVSQPKYVLTTRKVGGVSFVGPCA